MDLNDQNKKNLPYHPWARISILKGLYQVGMTLLFAVTLLSLSLVAHGKDTVSGGGKQQGCDLVIDSKDKESANKNALLDQEKILSKAVQAKEDYSKIEEQTLQLAKKTLQANGGVAKDTNITYQGVTYKGFEVLKESQGDLGDFAKAAHARLVYIPTLLKVLGIEAAHISGDNTIAITAEAITTHRPTPAEYHEGAHNLAFLNQVVTGKTHLMAGELTYDFSPEELSAAVQKYKDQALSFIDGISSPSGLSLGKNQLSEYLGSTFTNYFQNQAIDEVYAFFSQGKASFREFLSSYQSNDMRTAQRRWNEFIVTMVTSHYLNAFQFDTFKEISPTVTESRESIESRLSNHLYSIEKSYNLSNTKFEPPNKYEIETLVRSANEKIKFKFQSAYANSTEPLPPPSSQEVSDYFNRQFELKAKISNSLVAILNLATDLSEPSRLSNMIEAINNLDDLISEAIGLN